MVDIATVPYVDSQDALKAPLASPTFTGTVNGVTKAMVGLGNVDNTSDANKPVSTAQAAALTSFGRDRGSGSALPNTDLRRGDTYYHVNWTCLYAYNGTAWRQAGVPTIATNNLRNNYTSSYSDALHAGFKIWHSGLVCEQIWDGSAWRFTLFATSQVSTDTNGYYNYSHGAGQSPRCVVVGNYISQTAAQDGVLKWMYNTADSSIISFRAWRTDQSAAFNNPSLGISWTAWF